MLSFFYNLNPVIIYFLLWCSTFCLYIIKKRHFGIGGLILTIYAVSAFFSFYFVSNIGMVSYSNLLVNENRLTLWPFLYLYVNIFICIWPLLYYSGSLSKLKIQIADHGGLLYKFVYVSMPFVLIGFISILFFASSINTAALADSYEDTKEGGVVFSSLPWISKKCIVYISWMNLVWPILFFIFIVKGNKYAKASWIPLTGFIATILISYVCGARVGIFKSILFFIIIYLVFKNSLSQSRVRLINIILLSSVSLIAVTLFYITVSRFGDTNMDLLTWFSLYAGEGPLRFAEYAWPLTQTSNGDTCFSLIKEFLGFDTFSDSLVRREHYSMVLKIPTTIFYTYIGDWYIDLGPILTLLLSIGISVLIKKQCKRLVDREYKSGLGFVFFICFISLIFSFGFTYYVAKSYSTQLEVLRIALLILLYNWYQKTHPVISQRY